MSQMVVVVRTWTSGADDEAYVVHGPMTRGEAHDMRSRVLAAAAQLRQGDRDSKRQTRATIAPLTVPTPPAHRAERRPARR
jgi:hypothetical protein